LAKELWNNAIFVKSDNYEMVEGNVYFPSESVNWEYLTSGDKQYICPWKGKATYYMLVLEEECSRMPLGATQS